MNILKRGFSMTNVTVTLTVMTVIMSSVFLSTSEFEKQMGSKQEVAIAGGNTITSVSRYLSSSGNVASSNTLTNDLKYNISENKAVDIEVKDALFSSNTANVDVSFDAGDSSSYLGIDVVGGGNDINTYGYENGLRIDDTSLWTASERTNYKAIQDSYIKNTDFKELGDFVDSWSAKIDSAGSYIIYDFSKPVSINSFEFGLSQTGAISPKVISLTFDDSKKYTYSVDLDKSVQKLSFMDTKTRFVKVDLLSTSDGYSSAVSNELSSVTNINPFSISSEIVGSDLLVKFPSINNSEIKYYNFFVAKNPKKPEVPAIVIPQKNGDITVKYSNFSSRPEYVWVQACKNEELCQSAVMRPVNNLIFNGGFESGSGIIYKNGASEIIGGADNRWRFMGTASAGYDTTYKVEGNNSFKLSIGSGKIIEAMNEPIAYWSPNAQSIQLTPNTTYKLSFYYKTQYVQGASNHGFNAWLGTTNSTGGNQLQLLVLPSYVKTTQDWTYVEKTFTTGPNTTVGHLQFRLYGHTGGANLAMDAWVDDVILSKQ